MILLKPNENITREKEFLNRIPPYSNLLKFPSSYAKQEWILGLITETLSQRRDFLKTLASLFFFDIIYILQLLPLASFFLLSVNVWRSMWVTTDGRWLQAEGSQYSKILSFLFFSFPPSDVSNRKRWLYSAKKNKIVFCLN